MRLLKVPEAAAKLALSESQVYELARKRIIPSIRVGRSLRVPEEALDDWIRERTEVDDAEKGMGPREPLPAGGRKVDRPRRTPPRTGRQAPATDSERPGQGDGEATAPGVVRYLEVADADLPDRRRMARKVA